MSISVATRSERLKTALQQMEHRWGLGVVIRARSAPAVAGLSTGSPQLDRLTGRGGIPLHAITCLVGPATSGKLTVAFKVLSQAQQAAPMGRRHSVALLDLSASSDPDYLERAGIDLDRLLLVRPQTAKQALAVLLDLVRARELRAILVDSLPDLMVDRDAARAVEEMLPQVNLSLKSADCALVLLDESQPAWLPPRASGTGRAVRHYASLSLEFVREGWIESAGELMGYRVRATLLKSRGPRGGESTWIDIAFGQTVWARDTW